MNKKANMLLGIIIAISMVSLLSIVGVVSWKQGWFSTEAQESIASETAQAVAEQTKKGDVATVGVIVRDVSQNNVDTRLTTAVYCSDGDQMIIDGTSASATVEITGKTSIGKSITCWSFASTTQTLEPVTITVDEEFEHLVIDAYTVNTVASMSLYNDQLATDKNVSVPADGTGTFDKMRFKNNATSGDGWIPLGGIYFNTVASSNISTLDISGSAVLSGGDHSSTNLVASDLSTKTSSRKDNWDYVFEIDDDSGTAGNQMLILEENDYLDTGSVVVEGDGDGCVALGELVTPYAFTKGYYRNTLSTGVGFGHENDASSASVVSADMTDDTFYCTA